MNIQDELQKIHHQYGISEKANYEIQKLFDKQQERSYSEEELLDFSNWCRIQDNKYPNRVTTIQQLFEQFKKNKMTARRIIKTIK